MRVLYPISTRVSDFINEGAEIPSGWVGLWSIFCIALLFVVSSTLSVFEGGAAEQQHAFFSINRFNHSMHAKHVIGDTQAIKPSVANEKNRVPTQDYIDAHRCTQNTSCLKVLTMAAPAKPRAGADLYL